MNTQLIKYLEAIYPLSEEFKKSLAELIVKKDIGKTEILTQSKATTSIWLLEKGLAKGCYDDQYGKEHVTRFWKQGELMLLSYSVTAPIRADRIVMLEDSTVSTISYAGIIFLYHRFGEAAKLSSKILLNDRNLSEQRAFLCSLPKAEAYLEFKRLFPWQRLLHKDIARYLDISRGRLSEIKRNL
ncbi:MAG TPA: hypothetical protein VGN64_10700 [Dyadobacter sp.]|jgi:hypothetical protein|nr:hypothetical protein [Dyadobacter sp.]